MEKSMSTLHPTPTAAGIRLYADARFTSPYVMSAFVVLTEKGLPFEVDKVDLDADENKAEPYARLSLTQRVPTLVHGDFRLSESSAIAEYLDEEFAAPDHAPIYPRDRRQRALARQVQAWLRSDLAPIREERSAAAIFLRQPIDRPLSATATRAAAKLIAAAETLIPADAGALFGDWSIADTDLALMLNRLILNGDRVPSRLKAYAARQWERPSVQQWVMKDRSS
jgi:glutathione S-transferase